MKKNIIDIISEDFRSRFLNFTQSDRIKKLLDGETDHPSTELLESVLPPIKELKNEINGEALEESVYEGVLVYTIVQLVGMGKLSNSYLDSITELSFSYDLVKQLIPALQPKEVED